MPGWWKRFLKWRSKVAEESGGEPYMDRIPEKERSMMASEEEPRKGGWLSKWRAPKRREQQLATLQQGFSELVDLTRSIREHMDQQAQTQKTLLDMMKHIPGAVESLQSVGKATEQQTETLALLRTQLEAAARNEGHMVDSMRNFNKTLTLMDDMSKRTSQTVSSMADRTRDSEDMLRNILERSERRLVYTIVTLMVVTLTVLGVGLYIGLGGRPGSVMIEPVAPLERMEPFEHKKSITELGEEPAEEPVVVDPVERVEDDVPDAPIADLIDEDEAEPIESPEEESLPEEETEEPVADDEPEAEASEDERAEAAAEAAAEEEEEEEEVDEPADEDAAQPESD